MDIFTTYSIEIVIIVTVLFLLLAMLAIGIAIRFILRQNRAKDIVEARAFVLGNKSHQQVGYDIYDPYKLGASSQSIDFKTDHGYIVRLNVNTKQFHSLIEGMYGTITYQGNNLMSFDRLPDLEEMYRQDQEFSFQQLIDPASTVLVYADMPQSDLLLSTRDNIKVSLEKAKELAHDLFQNKGEPFIGFQDKKRIIQFAYSSHDDTMILDVPDTVRKGSEQAIIHSLDQMDSVIEAFFARQPLEDVIQTSFIKY